ncbi:MAG: UDP-N-acetylglucosamine 2-epimerase (non-hydrolyzing) [Deltaproteobacteria bacterium]|nr:UDP-N-acetylglucosamine 2-epimerase (non-hydrolyzing) [Deltaproteobacteria bacterium]
MKVLTVFGTRPEAIKMAPVVLALKDVYRITQTVCVTAQHREMLDHVLGVFGIKPDIDLDIMKGAQDLYDVTTAVLKKMRGVIKSAEPDVVLVQGDTTTAFSAALAAFYSKVKVAHVEAGLRTWRTDSPFPEEANRTLITRISHLHFAPTRHAAKNLFMENVPQERVFVTGNTVVDALLMARDRVREKGWSHWRAKLGPAIDGPRRIILVTCHRRENFGMGFRNICEALKKIAGSFKDISIVYPVHLNPNVRGPVTVHIGKCPNIHLIEPLEYEPFVYLMDRSFFIITDSGGIQEEAPTFGKPVVVMRDTTERPEALSAGTAVLAGTDPQKIFEVSERLLMDKSFYSAMSRPHNPFGDGNAAKRIADVLCKEFAVHGIS